MDALQQLPNHGDGLLDMREPARVLLESMVNEVVDAQDDMFCEDGADARDGHRKRCIVRLERDVCSLLPSRRHRAMAAKAMQAVFHESDPATVRSAYRAAINAVGSVSAVGALLEDAEADALAYLDFLAEHRRRIRTNNVQERMNREIKRRSRVVQVFPSPESMLRLVALCAPSRTRTGRAGTTYCLGPC